MGSTLWSSFFYRMLLLLVVCLGVAIGQEVTDEVIDNINEATGLALKDSFRCGLFFPDPADKSPDKSALPYLNLYIFNATFDAKSESTTRLCVAPRDFTLLVTSEVEI